MPSAVHGASRKRLTGDSLPLDSVIQAFRACGAGLSPGAADTPCDPSHALEHTLEPVNTGRAADPLLAMAEPIAWTEAHLCEADACPCPLTVTCDTRRTSERDTP
jgi:hypothetical protein